MTLIIKKVVKWETSDGKIHSTQEMANQYVLNADACERIKEVLLTGLDFPDAQDFVNWITSNSKIVMDLLDACDAMERASLR